MDKKSFGEWLKAKRKAKGLTQQELADKCGFTRESIVWWGKGRTSASLENAGKVVKALGTSLTLGDD